MKSATAAAEHHGPGLAAQRDRGRVGGRAVAGIDRRTVRGGHVGGVEQVLDAQRQAVQQAAHRARVEPACLRQCCLGREMLKGTDLGVALGHALQARPRQVFGPQFAPGKGASELPRVHLVRSQCLHEPAAHQSSIRSMNR